MSMITSGGRLPSVTRSFVSPLSCSAASLVACGNDLEDILRRLR